MEPDNIGEKRTRDDEHLAQLEVPEGKKPKLDEHVEYNLSQISSLLGAAVAPEDPFASAAKVFHETVFHPSQLPPLAQDPLATLAHQLASDDFSTDPMMHLNHTPQPKKQPKPKEPYDYAIDTLPADKLRILAGLDPIAPNTAIPKRTSVVGGSGRGRRRKAPIIIEEEKDPESKWNKSATERLIEVYHEFGLRRVVDQKLYQGVKECLEKGANPAVTLPGADGTSFFTILSVAAEKGVDSLVKELLSPSFRSEFSDFDRRHALQSALRSRQQEIAELLIRDGAPIDRETLMLIFDVQMSDESERKVAPLKALLERVDQGLFPAEEFYLPELINRAIYADNVAALKLLFKTKPEIMAELLIKASPIQNTTIRPGRGKAQDIGEGVPPLAFAAVMERGEVLETFLKFNADPNFKWDDMGGTLLHIVGFKNNCELIELLINYNADPRIPNSRGITVLSRTKGRKARKFIRDAMTKWDRLEKSHFEGTLLPSVSAALTGGSPNGPGLQSSITPQDLTLPPVYSPMHPPMPSHSLPPGMHGSNFQHSLGHQPLNMHHHGLHALQANHSGIPMSLGHQSLAHLGLHQTPPMPNHQPGLSLHPHLVHPQAGSYQPAMGMPSPLVHQSILQSGQQPSAHQLSPHSLQGFPPNPAGSE